MTKKSFFPFISGVISVGMVKLRTSISRVSATAGQISFLTDQVRVLTPTLRLLTSVFGSVISVNKAELLIHCHVPDSLAFRDASSLAENSKSRV